MPSKVLLLYIAKTGLFQGTSLVQYNLILLSVGKRLRKIDEAGWDEPIKKTLPGVRLYRSIL
jgi:hypothetical protein